MDSHGNRSEDDSAEGRYFSHKSQDEEAGNLRQLFTLCEKCQIIVDESQETTMRGRVFSHYDNWPAVKASADDGCGLCDYFLRGARATDRSPNAPDADRHLSARRGFAVSWPFNPLFDLYIPAASNPLKPGDTEWMEGNRVYVTSTVQIHPTSKQGPTPTQAYLSHYDRHFD